VSLPVSQARRPLRHL